MRFLWDFHVISVISMIFLWDFCEIPMGFPCYFYDLWDFCEILMGFPCYFSYFYDLSMGFL